MKLNRNFEKLQENYLFLTIAKRVEEYRKRRPDNALISMGIGDVTRPLGSAVIEALHKAADDMGRRESFKGYPPAMGYAFLREKIQAYYKKHGVELQVSEIFVGDGAKSDVGNIVDIFDRDNTVLVPDPVYPVYVDTNIMSGRRIEYIDANEENGFLPLPEKNVTADIIYLCSPNNPTGAAYGREGLKAWVDYALENHAVIIFDAAYEAFVSDGLPHSIFEVEGAKKCAVEFCSFSKTAGFTGMRCGYTIIPQELSLEGQSVNKIWARRQATKFNGVSYVTQRAAEAVFTERGFSEVMETIGYYKKNAGVMAEVLTQLGIWFTGGKNSPYIWMKCPQGMKSWDYFDYLLNEAEIVGTPGSGFGKNGEGFFRLTAFGDSEKTAEAMERIRSLK